MRDLNDLVLPDSGMGQILSTWDINETGQIVERVLHIEASVDHQNLVPHSGQR